MVPAIPLIPEFLLLILRLLTAQEWKVFQNKNFTHFNRRPPGYWSTTELLNKGPATVSWGYCLASIPPCCFVFVSMIPRLLFDVLSACRESETILTVDPINNLIQPSGDGSTMIFSKWLKLSAPSVLCYIITLYSAVENMKKVVFPVWVCLMPPPM